MKIKLNLHQAKPLNIPEERFNALKRAIFPFPGETGPGYQIPPLMGIIESEEGFTIGLGFRGDTYQIGMIF